MTKTKPVVLTIAGLDPSGGAGIIADIRTLVAFACGPVAALTSITFQNTDGVFGAAHQSAETLRAQIEPIMRESRIAAVKTGMLPTAELVHEVVRLISETDFPAPVVDPVLNSTSGFQLISDDAFLTLKNQLLPVARIVTPNIPEAERLTGFRIATVADMHFAAQAIRELGVRAVLLKGGHLRNQEEETEAVDILNDEGTVTVFRSGWIEGPEVRGTGCTLSAAIAACLGRGMSLEDSIRAAKQYVTNFIRNSIPT
jgi:hydroxymethylpyrimidine kinase/phosphomethylpyrimidine kinase